MFSKKFAAVCALALCAIQAASASAYLKVVDITNRVTNASDLTAPITLKVRSHVIN